MAKWSSENILLTQKGRELLSKVQSGVGKLTITRVLTGAGRVDPSALYNQTGVSDPKQDLTLVKVKTTEQGSNLDLKVNNFNLDTSYSVNQIGVYANHPDMGEILYMIAQCDEGTPDTMPLPSATPVTLNYKFFLIHGSSAELEITIEPAGYITPEDLEEIRSEVDYVEEVLNNHIEDFEKHKVKFTELCDFVGYSDNEVYGVEVDFENNICTRIGASVGLSPSDFDNIAPWGGRRRCNIDDEGRVLAYYGDDAYSDDGFLAQSVLINTETVVNSGTPVQTMVEQPKFWYKTVPVKLEKQEGQLGYSVCKARYYISPTPREGFKLFPLFERGESHKEIDFAYLSAYMGSLSHYTMDKAVFIVKVTGQATSSCEFGIQLDDYSVYKSFFIDGGDSAENVIDNIVSQSYSGWEVTKVGNDTAKFTPYDCRRYSSCNIIFAGTKPSGMTIEGTYSKEKGYLYDNDEVVTSESLVSWYKMCSVSGVKVATSQEYQILNPRYIRSLCKNRNHNTTQGFGWSSYDIAARCCTIWLHLIEYASFDCQTNIGFGENCSDSVPNGKTSSWGNKTGASEKSVTYRGEENIWAGAKCFVDGICVESTPVEYPNDGVTYVKPHISTSGIYNGDPSKGALYNYVGFSLNRNNGYVSRIGYSPDFDWVFLPTQGNGNNTTSMIPDWCSASDSYEEKTNFVCVNGGGDEDSGLVSYNFGVDTNNLSFHFAGRLLFIPEPKLLV